MAPRRLDRQASPLPFPFSGAIPLMLAPGCCRRDGRGPAYRGQSERGDPRWSSARGFERVPSIALDSPSLNVAARPFGSSSRRVQLQAAEVEPDRGLEVLPVGV